MACASIHVSLGLSLSFHPSPSPVKGLLSTSPSNQAPNNLYSYLPSPITTCLLSAHPSKHPSTLLCIQSTVYLSISLPSIISLSMHPFIYPFTHPSTYLPVHHIINVSSTHLLTYVSSISSVYSPIYHSPPILQLSSVHHPFTLKPSICPPLIHPSFLPLPI